MWRLRAPLALLAGRASADWTHAEAEKILGTTTVSDAPALEHGLSTCDVEMIQIEDRPAGNNYWTKSMVINAHVAARHNYTYTRVHAAVNTTLVHPSWCKLVAVRDAIEAALDRHKAAAGGGCLWIFYLDSDAFVRDSIDVARAIAYVAERADAQLVLARTDRLEGIATTGQPVNVFTAETRSRRRKREVFNAGVFFIRASPWAARLVRAWIRAPTDPPRRQQELCHKKLTSWPYEQSCLEDMLLRSSMGASDPPRALDDTKRILAVPMTLFNSPWGRLVTHAWSGLGGQIGRELLADHELRSSHGVFNLSREVRRLFGDRGSAARSGSATQTVDCTCGMVGDCGPIDERRVRAAPEESADGDASSPSTSLREDGQSRHAAPARPRHAHGMQTETRTITVEQAIPNHWNVRT